MLYEDNIDMKLCSTYGGCDSSSSSELLAARCVDSIVVRSDTMLAGVHLSLKLPRLVAFKS